MPTESLPHRLAGAIKSVRQKASLQHQEETLGASELEDEVGLNQAPNCAACTDNCCRAPNQRSLRLLDIARLVEAGLEDAILPPPDPAERASVYTAHPGLAEAEARQSFRRFPILAQKDGHCIFLDADERCTIYALRPQVCRSFPVQVNVEKEALVWSGRCASIQTEDSTDALHRLKEDAVYHYNAKADDLLMIRAGKAELRTLRLDGYIGNPALGDPFATVLARRQKK